MSDEEPFLARWSRRKHESKTEPAPPVPVEAKAPPPPPPLPPPPDLPPVESLTRDSDFSAFLKAGVPQDLKQAALRKLWQSDPALMAPEVMDLHMGDYTQPAVAEVVRTAWKLGKGMLDSATEEEESPAAQIAEETASTVTPSDAGEHDK